MAPANPSQGGVFGPIRNSKVELEYVSTSFERAETCHGSVLRMFGRRAVITTPNRGALNFLAFKVFTEFAGHGAHFFIKRVPGKRFLQHFVCFALFARRQQ